MKSCRETLSVVSVAGVGNTSHQMGGADSIQNYVDNLLLFQFTNYNVHVVRDVQFIPMFQFYPLRYCQKIQQPEQLFKKLPQQCQRCQHLPRLC